MHGVKTYLKAAAITAFVFASAVANAQTPPPIELQKAKDAFAEDRAVSDQEGGRLWGMKLYGATFFVDPQTRYAVSNEPDPQGVFRAQDGLYVGTLPQDVLISNAPLEWEGKRWTMLIWSTIPEDRYTRRVMFAHESFHRIQPALHLDAPDPQNPQLGTAEGRL
jgi:hypothetical protein